MNNILIIGKSKIMTDIMKKALLAYGFTVGEISYKQFKVELLERNFKFVVLNLVNIDDPALIRAIREKNLDLILIVITERRDLNRKRELITLGADNIIYYPFPMKDLILMINSYKRRLHNLNKPANSIKLGDLLIDFWNKKVYIKNKEIYFSNKEFNILEYLVKNLGRPISRNELLDNIWNYKHFVTSNTIDVHIRHLRNKLPKDLIKTVYGRGYQIERESFTQEELDATNSLPEL